MIGIGYGSHTSVTRSHRPIADTESTSSLMTLCMNGLRRSAEAGVNAGATKRRRRVWRSPSIDRIDSRRPSRNPPGSNPDIWGMRDRAEWNRRSLRQATASGWWMTENPRGVRASQWSRATSAAARSASERSRPVESSIGRSSS